MVAFDSRILERRQQFKPAFDAHVARRRRESDAAQIRKAQRTEVLTKRRIGCEEDQENLPAPNANGPTAPTVADLPSLLEKLRKADGEDRLEPTRALQKLITANAHASTGAKVLEAGALPELVKSMQVSSECALEACWALSNLASDESAVALTVADESLLKTLLELFANPDSRVREHAISAVANIAGDGVEGRDAVLAAGGLQVLLETIVHWEQLAEQNGTPEAQRTSHLRTCTWALHNFARGQPAPDLSMAVPVLRHIVFSTNANLLADALWALVFIAEGSEAGFQQVMAAEILGQVIMLLGHEKNSVVTPALRLCLNVSAGTDEDLATALGCGLATAVKPLLAHAKSVVRQDAAMLLSNVACGPPAQVQELFTEGLMEDLLGLMSSGPNDVRREAVVAVANACSAGSPPQLIRLLKMHAVQVLCERLAGPDVDSIQCVLGALRVLLETYEPEEDCPNPCNQLEEHGREKLEELQTHEDCSISELAVYLCTYFGDEEMDDPDHAFLECKESFDFS